MIRDTFNLFGNVAIVISLCEINLNFFLLFLVYYASELYNNINDIHLIPRSPRPWQM